MALMNDVMKNPFPRSVSIAVKCTNLHGVIRLDDKMTLLSNVDFDVLASALALKRIKETYPPPFEG
jgi:hypothetical protein